MDDLDPPQDLGFDWFAEDEVAGITGSFSRSGETLERLLWADCTVSAARLAACTVVNSQFERVTFDGCDLSGTTFVECSFRDCTVRSGKCASFLSFADCIIGGLAFEALTAESIELQGGRLQSLRITGCFLTKLLFNQVGKPSGRKKGEVIIDATELASVGGVSKLPGAGIDVRIDEALWTMLGDLLLRQTGIEKIQG